jgi:pimeloyl-ACP methyl ester carboxylesterase
MDRAASFDKVLRRLDDLEVVAYDRRGYASAVEVQPRAATVDDHVDDLLAVLQERPAVVVGHSLGGVIALTTAVRRPDLVPAVGVFEPPLPWMGWWPADTAGGAAVAAAEDPAQAAEAFMRRMIGDPLWERLPEKTKAARRAEGAALVADITAVHRDAPFELADVVMPVVVGRGSLARPHQYEGTQRLAAELPDAELYEIEGGRHGSHLSHPDEFAAFVRLVLSKVTGRFGAET